MSAAAARLAPEAPVERKGRACALHLLSKTPPSSGDAPFRAQPALLCAPGSSPSSTSACKRQTADPKGALVPLQRTASCGRAVQVGSPGAWGGCVVETLPGAMATARERPLCLRGRQHVCPRHGRTGPATFRTNLVPGTPSASMSSGTSKSRGGKERLSVDDRFS